MWIIFSVMSEWLVKHSDQFIRDMKRMVKNHPRETEQMIANLDQYKDNLAVLENPLLMVDYSYVHRESSGCHAITQQPLSSATQTRLYVYCYVKGHELHLICAGNKQSQRKDNQFCAQYVKNL